MQRIHLIFCSHIPEETIMDMPRLAIEHLKNWKCEVGVHCLKEYIQNI